MCADCCHSGGTGSFVQTVQVPAGEFHGYAGHVGVPPQTVLDVYKRQVYLNGEEVFSATPLQAYDLIDFGETKLLFVPLCGERFTWKKEEQKDDGPA